MGLFDGFKKLFRQEIKLDKADKGKIVSLAKLKNGKLKFGSVLKVEEDYKAVTVYFNNVLDVLEPGAYEIKETTVPKLFMLFFRGIKKEGIPLPDYIKDCELYFVSEKEHSDFKFEHKFKALSQTNKARIKMRSIIKYSVKVSSVEKFMIYLCNTYPIVQNSKAIEEISFISKKRICDLLSKGGYSFEDYFLREDKIVQDLTQELKLATDEFGFEVTDINFFDLKVPKKYLSLKIAALQKKVDIVNASSEARKASTQSDSQSMSFNQPTSFSQSADIPKENNFATNNIIQNESSIKSDSYINKENVSNQNDSDIIKDDLIDIDELYKDFKKQESQKRIEEETNSSPQPSPQVIEEERRKKQRKEEYAKFNLRREGQSRLSDLIDDYVISDAPQKNPMIFEERKEVSKEVKETPKERKLITCECCGAKNYEGDEYCCVCKSKL